MLVVNHIIGPFPIVLVGKDSREGLSPKKPGKFYASKECWWTYCDTQNAETFPWLVPHDLDDICLS